jgi:phosphoribosylpyrophosphate synthetase
VTADDVLVFGGSGSPKLTRKICEYLHMQPGAREVLRFSEGNLFVRVQENVRGAASTSCSDGLSRQRSFHGASSGSMR